MIFRLLVRDEIKPLERSVSDESKTQGHHQCKR